MPHIKYIFSIPGCGNHESYYWSCLLLQTCSDSLTSRMLYASAAGSRNWARLHHNDVAVSVGTPADNDVPVV